MLTKLSESSYSKVIKQKKWEKPSLSFFSRFQLNIQSLFVVIVFFMKALFETASTMKLPHPANLWIIKLTNASCYFYSLS